MCQPPYFCFCHPFEHPPFRFSVSRSNSCQCTIPPCLQVIPALLLMRSLLTMLPTTCYLGKLMSRLARPAFPWRNPSRRVALPKKSPQPLLPAMWRTRSSATPSNTQDKSSAVAWMNVPPSHSFVLTMKILQPYSQNPINRPLAHSLRVLVSLSTGSIELDMQSVSVGSVQCGYLALALCTGVS